MEDIRNVGSVKPYGNRAYYLEHINVSNSTTTINIKPFLSYMIVKKNDFLPKTQTIHQDLKTKSKQIFVNNTSTKLKYQASSKLVVSVLEEYLQKTSSPDLAYGIVIICRF